jgi:hypothetical protein
MDTPITPHGGLVHFVELLRNYKLRHVGLRGTRPVFLFLVRMTLSDLPQGNSTFPLKNAFDIV